MTPFHYRWRWTFQSSPERLWPLLTDTNRFNRDSGVPNVERRPAGASGVLANARQRLRLMRLGVAVEWEEEPFEWVRPSRFGVVRRYSSGPVAEMRVLVEVANTAAGGSDVTYQVWAQPRTWLGLVAIPTQIGLLSARRFEATLRQYDRIALGNPTLAVATAATPVELAPGGRERLAEASAALVRQGQPGDLVAKLARAIEEFDDFSAAAIRPYALADAWSAPRRAVLELCLAATRAGLLEFRWRVLCPLCRGAQNGSARLSDVRARAHCDSCNIDFSANFEQSVELTFRPNAAVREVRVFEFCVGGPQLTPHIVAQQLLPAGAHRALTLPLETGRYRLRTLAVAGGQSIVAADDGVSQATLRASLDGWPDAETRVSTMPALDLENATGAEQLFVLERMAWNDQAATAADVTILQTFRDLFASEALRPGEELSVGNLAIVFTDLRGSTALYREIGDAVAFGRVQDHFDLLKKAIADEGGSIVKTIGDAVMAVFRRPVAAMRAMAAAQRALAAPAGGAPALRLKVGLHYGTCLAVTQNDRLDYFGSAINIAARLEGQSSGEDLVISWAVRDDPEVAEWLEAHTGDLSVTLLEVELKGFDQQLFQLWRVTRKSPP